MSSGSDDDDVPVGKLGAMAGGASGTSDSEPDWIKSFQPKTAPPGGSSVVDITSTSDSEGLAESDDEDKPLASYMRPADSESDGVSSDSASEPKAKRKKVTGVPSVVPLTLLGRGRNPKLKTTNLLLQLEDQEFDLSGDTGAVGRYNASRKKVELDMKGVTYAGSVVKCHTLCTVLVTDGKAEIKEVFGNFVHLTKTADVRDREEMTGGDFDDFGDFEISGDESVDEGGGTKSGRKKGAKGRKPLTKKPAPKRASGPAGAKKKITK